jgi:lipopolysaccharide transport system permease protein
MAELSNPPYEVVLQPSRGWLRVDWRELWEYRDLLLILVHRDFIARYKQTLLGPLW